MRKINKLLFKLLIVVPIFAIAQSGSNTKTKSYDKLDHIKIDKIIYYQTPYYLCAHKPIETPYFPSWYWGYCAKNYPLGFKNYSKEANSFMLPPKSFSETQLNAYETKFKNLKLEDYPNPYVYCYGEIYFTHKKTKKEYLMVLTYEFAKEIPNIDFNKIDTLKFKTPKDERYKNNKAKPNLYSQLYDAPTHINYYVLDSDGVYKEGDNAEIYKNVLQDGNSNFKFGGNRFDYFLNILKRSPNYIRSYIVNGERFFETNKQTLNGIISIGNKRKKP